jgi:hypothetical protein
MHTMTLHTRRKAIVFQPVDRTADETKAIMAVRPGMTIHQVQVLPLVAAAASTNSTIEVGDGVDPNGYVIATTDYDPEASVVGTLINGTGAYLVGAAVNGWGKVYLVEDTIDVVYTNATEGATNPKIKIFITYTP